MNPRGTLRMRFEGAKEDDVFRRLGVGARRCDLGDEGLYLAEELVAADRWLGGSDPEALGILVLALMIAQRQGSTRLPLDTSPKVFELGLPAQQEVLEFSLFLRQLVAFCGELFGGLGQRGVRGSWL